MILLFMILPLFCRRYYELFLKSHLAIAIFMIYALWHYVKRMDQFNKIYIITSAALLTATSILYFLQLLFRNFVYEKPQARLMIIINDEILDDLFKSF